MLLSAILFSVTPIAATSNSMAIAAAAQETAAPYPAQKILSAFATACSNIESLSVTKATAIAAGWEEKDPDPGSTIGQLVAYGKAEMGEDNGIEMLDGATYHQKIAGRDLWLVVSGVKMDSITSHGCRLYDTNATSPIAEDTLKNWAVRQPTKDEPMEGLQIYSWAPGLKPGHQEMQVQFVKPGTQLPLPVTLSGLVFTASVINIGE